MVTKIVAQTRKPEGFLGRLMVGGMNGGHAKLADWGMSHLNGGAASHIAELGCGGGRNAGELLRKYPQARLSALDHSERSVEKAKKYNKKTIALGRCSVLQGDVAALPFGEEAFDLVTAFETVYFWPGPESSFAEVYRVLKPGGIFLVCNESDGTDEAGLKYEAVIDGMKCYTVEQLAAAMRAVGFSDVTADHHSEKPWITVLARK